MTKSELPKLVSRRMKIVGRGRGSGKGSHTVGRGQKGQGSRGKIGILFEGLKMKKSLIKRLPLQRGKGKFHPGKEQLIVKLAYLNLLPAGSHVTLDLLISEKIVDASAKDAGVKILGGGEITKKFTIEVPISHSAAKQIEKAGGKVV
ncbi:MAG: 50S ribosomal protein L15 [Microgenomates group bacterium]